MFSFTLRTSIGLILAVLIGTFVSEISAEDSNINTSDALISQIINNCLESDTTVCFKRKVLNYLDNVADQDYVEARSFDESKLDSEIYNRVRKILSTNELKFYAPGDVAFSYNKVNGFNVELPQVEGKFVL